MQTLGWRSLGLSMGALTALVWGCGDETTSAMNTTANGGDATGGMANTGGGTPTTTTTGGNGPGGSAAGGNGSGGSGNGGSTSYEVCANPPVNYPAGPYGSNVGDVFEPLEIAGWTNPAPTQQIDAETFGAYTMDDLRADHPGSFVMLHLSGMF